MSNLLTKSEKRRLKIIDYLDRKKEPMTLEEIANHANTTTKTLQADFKFFEEYWIDCFFIDITKTGGYRLYFRQNHNMMSLYKRIAQESPALQFMEELLFHPFLPITEWTKKLYLSESTLYRLVKQINENYTSLDFKVNTQGAYIDGKESHVRLLYGTFFEQVYDFYYWPFENIEKLGFIRLVKQMSNFLGRDLNDRLLYKISIASATTLLRAHQGFYIKGYYKSPNEDEIVKQLTLVEEKVKQVVKFPLPPNWQQEIARTVMFFDVGWDNEGEKKRIYQSAEDFVASLQKKLKLNLLPEYKQPLIERLVTIYTSYKSFPYFNDYLSSGNAIKTTRLSEQYRELYEEVSKELVLLEKKMIFPWHSQMAYRIFETILAEWRYLTIQLDHKKESVKILVVSSLGVSHAHSLKARIDTAFSFKAITQTYEKQIIDLLDEKEIFDEFDIVVINVCVPELLTEKEFHVDTMFSPRQLNELGMKIDQLQIKKELRK
ncbi:MAG: helix-turn-helix domain-containing protein [Streptococcaceae bacterium]|jgi:hypothetical protein|nr:helix-turn-helix domain-containing protein [Streptococcaceae bacterium]